MAKIKKISLKVRLMVMVASLLIIAFLTITFTFNSIISSYMENGANDTLSKARLYTATNPPEKPKPGSDGRFSEAIAGRAESVLLSTDYEQLQQGFHPDFEGDAYRADFVKAAAASRINLDSETVDRLETDSALYYYTAVRYNAVADSYLVYFINMTVVYNFSKSMTAILLIVMAGALALALVVTYLIANRIAGPIRLLSDFAVRIGEAKYGSLDADFHDRELHNLRESMNETSKRLEDYDAEQKTFFQNVSHELRTPLQIIKTNAEGIAVGIFDKDKAAYAIIRETDNLGDMVEDLLYMSRLETKSHDMEQTDNDLRESLSYVISRYDSVLANKGIKVAYDFDENPVLFRYDEKSMERALQNLVSNAIRYTRNSIRVVCRRTADRIILGVEDNGSGIKDQDLPRIFDRFYKGENGKHGIGLSIVKSIVTTYGGRIEVSTSPEGTLFTVFLPG